MHHKRVYRIYTVNGTPGTIRARLIEKLVSAGFRETGRNDTVISFRYPSVRFSSKRPLTCISHISLDISGGNGRVRVTAGVSLLKIKVFIIAVIVFLCGIVPVVLGYIQNGMPEIPTVAYLGIPLGVMTHFHVRWRVFRALGRIIEQTGDR